MRAFWALVWAGGLTFLRDRSAVLWSFVVPVVLVLVVGALFGRAGTEAPPRYGIGLVLDSTSPEAGKIFAAFSQQPLFDLYVGEKRGELQALQTGRRQAVLVFPDDAGARFLAGQATPVSLRLAPLPAPQLTVVRGLVTQTLELAASRLAAQPPRLVLQEDTPPKPLPATSNQGLDFALPGLLTVTILQLGLFAALPLIQLRQGGVLRRLRATPVAAGTLVASQVVVRVVVGLVQLGIVVGLGQLAFQFRLGGSIVAVMALVGLGVVLFVSLGAALSALARTAEAGAALVQAIQVPLLLFSGLLIPVELLPTALRWLPPLLPTAALGDALRQVMLGTLGTQPLGSDLLALTLWLALSAAAAARWFRWE